jgi:hypothetical membrane protein
VPTSIFSGLAMAGTGVILGAVIYSALRYRGRTGERYSLFNHFVSELGERGVSRGAWAFNGGLVLGGILLLPLAIRMGAVLDSVLGWVAAFFAAAAALGAAGVGMFPMNTLKRHVPAAMTFFYGGLFMALAFGVAILTQPAGRVVIPKAASALSLLAAAAFSSFVVLPPIVAPQFKRISRLLDPTVVSQRPRFWILPFMEWQVLFSTIAWLLGMAFFVPQS